jgi:hypothetical protein
MYAPEGAKIEIIPEIESEVESANNSKKRKRQRRQTN